MNQDNQKGTGATLVEFEHAPGVEYRHFRITQGKREMGITACTYTDPAYEFQRNQGVYGLSLAFCCSHDKFSKAMGRMISARRLGAAWAGVRAFGMGRTPSGKERKFRFVWFFRLPTEHTVTTDQLIFRLMGELKGPPWFNRCLKPAMSKVLAERLTKEPPA